MLVNQIAVFLENRSGRVADFSRVLRDNGINIQTMSIADTVEFGILRAITDDNTKAIKALKANGFNATAVDLIGFCVDDKPGEMFNVLKILEDEKVNIAYLYSFARNAEKAIILIKVDDNEKTSEILKAHGINLLEENII